MTNLKFERTEAQLTTDGTFLVNVLRVDGVRTAEVVPTGPSTCTLRMEIPTFDLGCLSKISKLATRYYGNQKAHPSYDGKDSWLSIEVQRLV